MKDLTILLITISFFTACQKPSPLESTMPPPNILFILADDLGYKDLSCMGSAYYETPNIDRIANEGMVFTNGYAACQVCSPSRASIMSGKFPARHGITDWIGARTDTAWRAQGRFNQLLPPEYVHQLPADYITLPEALKQGAYQTFFAGKWHLGKEGSWPTDHGFDINVGGWDKGSPIGGYYAPWTNPNLADSIPGENLSMRLAHETARFIKEHKDTSFFAFLSFYAVHGPIQTTQTKWAKYRDKADQMGIAASGFEMGKYLPIRQVQDNPIYAGLVETMDDAVGVVLDALDALGLSQNTIVIFTSDNGGVAAGDAFATSNLPLKAGKGYQFEGGIREPYFIKAPGWTQPGQQSDVPVTGTDFYPTILELAGLNLRPREHTDGLSLVSLMHKDTIANRPLIWHYPHYGNQGGEPSSIIRKGPWKLIHYYEDERKELYNLETDLSENNDLAEEHSDITQNLSDELFQYLEEVGAKYPKRDPIYDKLKEQTYLKQIVEKRWPQLEAQRLEFLSPGFDPGNFWWDSALE